MSSSLNDRWLIDTAGAASAGRELLGARQGLQRLPAEVIWSTSRLAAGGFQQGDVALQHDPLGHRRDRGQAHAAGELTADRRAALGQPRVHRTVGQQGVEALGVGQDALHDLAVDDRLVGVGDVDAARLAHQADLGHLLAMQALGRRAGDEDAGAVDVARATQDEVDDAGVVDGRIAVSGWTTIEVTPPAAAALRCRSQGFLGLEPRARRCLTRRSIRPGASRRRRSR
jgi:hypothetical protein